MERGLSFEDLKLDFLLEGFKLDERGLSFQDLKVDGEGTIV